MAWKDDIATALERLGGFASRAELFVELEKIRPRTIRTWVQTVQGTIERHSSDSVNYRGGEDLFYSVAGIGSGIWGLRSALPDTPKAIDLPGPGEESAPERVEMTVYRILRDSHMARQVKLLHDSECQVCGLALQLPNGERYAEAHHIIPIGRPHNGPDTASNILIVCPNHHALCDLGAITLDPLTLREAPGHSISETSVSYHNEVIHGSR